ncbi:hypothetical protein MJO28_001561 [Puccinia striiformis f. sp. tritici]|uniref:Uncharacterized protein n=2 Tax=Puccinia striiformis TaxID=27350 RepID=A0A2S4WC28_9BASI|nr:hypothetical protein MJO28_001561 [Puccinia striiformis f. sp. tritici]POW19267.1 hypothetical protein PSHT_04822 [Puccinia striiformis]
MEGDVMGRYAMNAMGCTRASLGLIYSEGCGPDSLRGQAKHARHSVPIWCQPWLDPAMGLTAMLAISCLHYNKECGRVNSRQIQQEIDCEPPGRIGRAEQSTSSSWPTGWSDCSSALAVSRATSPHEVTVFLVQVEVF